MKDMDKLNCNSVRRQFVVIQLLILLIIPIDLFIVANPVNLCFPIKVLINKNFKESC